MPLRPIQHLRHLSQRLVFLGGTALGIISLSSCSVPYSLPITTYNPQAEYDLQTASEIYTDAFDHITEYYIEEIDVSQLALAAMDNLTTIDPELEIIDNGNSLTITYSGEPISRHGYPSTLDSIAWAWLTASVISEAQSLSSEFQKSSGEKINQAVFDGVAGELDKFSRYSPPDKAKINRDNRNGFGGLGIRYVKDPKGAHIIAVMEKTPAEAVGLMAGDIITRVDGKNISQLSEKKITRLMKGPENSKVRISVLRKNKASDTIEMEITRKKIIVQTVYYSSKDGIAYFKITSFNNHTPQSMLDKVRKAQKENGDNLKGYIIDLRDNGGGVKNAAVVTADLLALLRFVE
ncbi:S41 family peptidase [Kiloniella sp.]|uniref:S41 family peptidase n=1 Tax=Kiloniella sp. TaxID=1938587 RepID=UPI003B026421